MTTLLLIAIAWLLPTLLVGALMWRRDPTAPESGDSRRTLAAIIASLALSAAFFQAFRATRIDQTAALFIGIPALLAMAAVFAPARTAVGVAMKATTIGLLISMIFLGEGMLCVVLSAPLFYFVAVVIGLARDHRRANRIFPAITLLVVAPMSFEGVLPHTTIPRETTVSESRIVRASADAVGTALLRAPRFDRALPPVLTWGFPRPLSSSADGARLEIQMRGGEMRLDGMEPRVGTLVLVRDHTQPNVVRWRAVSDDSHMRHFLTWLSSEVSWSPIDAHTTRVTWTIRYRRDLDPAWYFGPMERFVVGRAADYLIASVATP